MIQESTGWRPHSNRQRQSRYQRRTQALVKNKVQVVSAIENFLYIKFQELEDSSISILIIIYNHIYQSNNKPRLTDQVFHQVKNSKNRFSISRS